MGAVRECVVVLDSHEPRTRDRGGRRRHASRPPRA
jgi:hypothetical protein